MIFLGTTAAAWSTVLVFGHATNNTPDISQVHLAAATIGIGGRGDPDAVNVPHKLQGNVLPPTFSYIPVHYPAGFDIDNSTNAGVPVLAGSERASGRASGGIYLLCYTHQEGTRFSLPRRVFPGASGAGFVPAQLAASR